MITALPGRIALIGGAFIMALAIMVLSRMGYGPVAPLLPLFMAGGLVVFFYPFLGLLFIAFFVQLDALLRMVPVSDELSPEKVITFVSVLGLLVISFKEPKKLRWGPHEPLVSLAVMFGLTLLTALFFVKDLEFGLWSVRRLISLLGLLYLTVRVVKTIGHIKWIALAIIVSSLISSVLVIADYSMGGTLVGSSHAATVSSYDGVSRSSGGSDYNPTTAATMNLAGTTLALILFLRQRKWRILTGPLVVLGSIAIMLSLARSSSLVYILLVVWLWWKFRRHRLMPAAFVLAVILGAMVLPLIPSTYYDRMLTLVEDWDQDKSITARISYNKIGLELLAQHPVLGIGPGQFQYYYADPEYRFVPSNRLFIARQLHNMYLEVATETGLVGGGLFLAMIIMGGVALHRVRKYGATEEIRIYGEAFHYSYVGFMAVSVFMPNEYNKYVWLFIGLGVAFARATGTKRDGRSVPIGTAGDAPPPTP